MTVTYLTEAPSLGVRCKEVDCPHEHCVESHCRRHTDHAGVLVCPSHRLAAREALASLVAMSDPEVLWRQALHGATRSGKALASSSECPGGEALLVYVGGWADPAETERLTWVAEARGTAMPEQVDETPSQWVDRWERDIAEQRDTKRVDLADSIDFLSTSPAWVGFVHGLRGQVASMERLLYAGEEVRRTPVRCPDAECGGRLEWVDDTADPEQDGWQCMLCGWWLTEPEVVAAARAQVLATDQQPVAWLGVAETAATLGVPPYTVRTWVQRDTVEHRVEGGSVRVSWASAVAKDQARRERLAARQVAS